MSRVRDFAYTSGAPITTTNRFGGPCEHPGFMARFNNSGHTHPLGSLGGSSRLAMRMSMPAKPGLLGFWGVGCIGAAGSLPA